MRAFWLWDDILVLFNRISVIGRETKFSYIDMDNTRLWDWISTEVSEILLEESPGIIGWITDIMIFMFVEQTAAILTVGKTLEVTRGRSWCASASREEKAGIRFNFFNGGEGCDVANLGTGSRGDFDICNKYGGTYKFSCYKLKYYKCREKWHIVHDCKKGHTCFHCHQSVHLKSDCPTWVTERVQAPTPIVRQEVKAMSLVITYMNFDLQFI